MQNIENRILNSNKNIIEKTEKCKSLEDDSYIISYALSVAQLNVTLIILLINQWYLESQKLLSHYSCLKKFKERLLIKKKKIKNYVG